MPETAILITVLCVAGSAFFSGIETGITSARRIPILHRAKLRHWPSRLAARLLRHREDGIVTAVVGNNITLVAGTSVATAACLARFGHGGETVAAVGMTAINIVFAEILPKSLYRAKPERMLTWSAPLFVALDAILFPLRWLAAMSAQITLRLAGLGRAHADPVITRQRLLAIFRRSHQHQELDAQQQDLVRRLVGNCRTPVEKIVTPMDAVARLRCDDTVADAIALVRETGHSRLPVTDEEENIRGLVLFRDLIHARREDRVDLYERTLTVLPRDMGLDEAIGALTDQHQSMAAVVDFQDRSIGILTLEDLLEPLVGEIVDEHDVVTVQAPSPKPADG
jgi:putative hemolysin